MGSIFCFRLSPNQDLKNEINRACSLNNITAGCILSAVGSLSKAKLRLPGTGEFFESDDKFEIVSVTGTVAASGSHIHLSIADGSGKVMGGHLVDGNLIYTTCEIVILNIANVEFSREHDALTGYKELQIKKLT